ncbi:flagellar hook-associated protein FlgK [Citrobacter amalonaticus]|uniref:Flagellar hook-associated protein 1 n=1 Tax=Citrobacter amalonaticus TaxID=35703 RepID=A0A2S4RRD6_CITAM|nr:flagellar hook-associated protein FlgK [Citrobacter amalonaticus]POT54751.1 flagellar hook-associated protein FlgK [Citrobacter amalonaticus]POT69959.1 flagellar hook-associated protein FlgK [Citrobacter amalonaticus]POU61218.1 flagellar hook-associated protein FlgK [Citrobacter amalonaticus]POV02572.1 flagellar hook-associated protein FlgK [Citrobacter amalonaticus]
MNLMYLAQSGLSSAQSALNVVGNNLSNAMTPGYSRQHILLGEAGGKTTGYGYFGYGVQVNGVQRAYDAFVNNQVRSAATEYQSMASRYEQLSQIDNMLGDDTYNISVSMGAMFGAMEKMSSDPVSAAARQETLSQFNALSYQYQTNSKTLNGLEKSTNTQITQSVDEINATAEQLAKLNQEIAKIHGQTGTIPPNLMDQRDQLLSKLNDHVGIRVTENPTTGRVDVTMANGLPLVNGDRSYKLEASPAAENPNKIVVSYVDASGNALPLDESKITTGKLGGLFKFRNEDLEDSRNQLNMLALQMANRLNEVNQQGYDLNGNPGGDIFNIPDPVALVNRNNTGDADLKTTYTDVSQVKAQDYTLTFKGPDANDWEVKDSYGAIVPTTIGEYGELMFDGISVSPQGNPQENDSFILNPVAGVADKLSVAITDGNQIAASSSPDPDDESNNENIKAMIAIKDEALIGKSTLTEAYASLVSSVGSAMTALKANASTSAKTYEAMLYQQQAISGVDLNEEYINLQMYSQYYQANAQVLQTATTLFDTILSIR